MSDILHGVRKRILDEDRKLLRSVPKDLKQTWEGQAAWAGAISGAVSGGVIGSHVGLAMGPLGAMAGTIPGAIIGGIVGAFGAAKAGASIEKGQSATSRSVRDVSYQTTITTELSLEGTDFCNSCKADRATKLFSSSGLRVCSHCGSANLRDQSRLLTSSPKALESSVD